MGNDGLTQLPARAGWDRVMGRVGAVLWIAPMLYACGGADELPDRSRDPGANIPVVAGAAAGRGAAAPVITGTGVPGLAPPTAAGPGSIPPAAMGPGVMMSPGFAMVPSEQAFSMTVAPTGTISPDSSRSGMNSAGDTRPRSGCFQRSSASTPTTRRVAADTRGW